MEAKKNIVVIALKSNTVQIRSNTFRALLPIVTAVFVAFLVIGIALPIIPLHVHGDLGLGTFAVGLVSGSQFTASLLSRFWAGSYSDRCGTKRSVVIGLALAVIAGIVYYLSFMITSMPLYSAATLIAGRGILGAAESFIITGTFSWGVARAGNDGTGVVMSWVGTAMYIAYAVGAPLGTVLNERYGFAAIALAIAIIPLITLGIVVPVKPVAPTNTSRPSFTKVIGTIWLPGCGLALSSVGYGAITTFVVLLFDRHGWGQAWVAFTALSVGFMAGRVLFGHLPDRIGGAKVAFYCLIIEAAGLVTIWLAPWAVVAFAGAALTGLGYSLVYPGFGVVAMESTPPENRGLVMGAFTAFLDLALGVAGPLLGLMADGFGIQSIYLVGTVITLAAMLIAKRLMKT